MKGHDTAALIEPLKTITASLEQQLVGLAERAMDDGPIEMLSTVAANLRAISDFAEPTLSKTVVKALVDRATPLVAAYAKHQKVKSKVNRSAFNKSAMMWKDYKLGPTVQDDAHKNMLHAFLVGLMPVLAEHKALQQSTCKDAVDVLKDVARGIAVYAGGGKDSMSWKAAIAANVPLKEVLDIAAAPRAGLLSGPGTKISTSKTTLVEAS